MGEQKLKVFIVIPAFNEEDSLVTVISKLRKAGYQNIVVVDDGSKDNTFEIARSQGVFVYRHVINRGLGGALSTGIKAALKNGADVIVTYDADGQHTPEMADKAVTTLAKTKADFVIGSRLLRKTEGMPLLRRVGNFGFNVITFLLFGVWTTDSQSGLRCFTRGAALKLELKTSRMEVSSEFIKEVGRNNFKFREAPIKAIYTDYSMMKGQSSLNAFKILFKLILRKLMR